MCPTLWAHTWLDFLHLKRFESSWIHAQFLWILCLTPGLVVVLGTIKVQFHSNLLWNLSMTKPLKKKKNLQKSNCALKPSWNSYRRVVCVFFGFGLVLQHSFGRSALHSLPFFEWHRTYLRQHLSHHSKHEPHLICQSVYLLSNGKANQELIKLLE